MNVDDPGTEGIEESAEVFDFLDAYHEDLEVGELHPLSHYLERFPGREEAVSREYLAQRERSRGARAPGAVALPVLEGDSQVGPYRLLSEIGRGGQGVVYLAEDKRISRRVALKVLPPAALLLSEDRRRRLRREAEVISRLAHPGICGIFDAEIERELAYIAMPFVEGRTLASVIAEVRDGTRAEATPTCAITVRPASEARLLRLLGFFEAAARALHSAHDAGIVHRDIKPANLMVTPEGRPVWLDFGQARDVQSQVADLTLSGEVFGTPAYMSPEQVAGRPSDARTDVWALGVSLFEALTLRRPFEGASVHVLLLAVQSEEPLDARKLNPVVGEELAVVLATALERDVTRRYSSALELAEDLARIQRREPIHARATPRLLRLQRWVQRHPVLFVAILTISASLLVTSYLLVQQSRILGEKEQALGEKDLALRFALGRHLAGRSEALLAEDPASALILGIQASERAPSSQARGALFSALEACQLRAVYDAKDDSAQQSRFRDVKLVPGGELVAALRFDGQARAYDLLSGVARQSWRAHEPQGDANQPAGLVLACAANGRLVATGGSEGRVCVRDLVAERTLATFAGLGGAVSELCFGAQDATLAVRSASGLGLFRVSDGESLARLVGETGLPLAFDAAAGRFVEAPGPAEPPEHLRAWDGATGEPEPATTPPTSFAAWVGPQERVLFSRVSPGGERLFLVTSQGSATRATLVDLLARQARDYPLAGEGAPADCAFSPQGERVAVIEPDGVLRLRDARSLALLATCRGYLNPEAVEWSADGDWLLTRRRNGTQARLWYATERPDVYTLRCGDSPLRRVEFSPDGEHALTTSERGEVILWRTPSQPFRGSDSGARLATLGDAREPLAGASFDPRGGHVLSWGGRGVELRTIEDGLSERTLEVLGGASQAQLAPDGESILIQTSSGPSLWSREALQLRSRAGAVLWEIEFVEDALLWARFSPDGQRLFCVHRSGSLVCRDAMRGAELWRVPARRSAAEIAQSEASPTIVDLAFSPEAAVVAVAREDRSVHFFSTREGGVVRDSLAIFPPQSIDWSADGRRLLVTGATGRGAVRVEDLEPSQPGFNVLRAEFFHADDLTGGSFSPDGRLVLTTSLDGTIMVRDVSGSLDPRSMTLVAHLRGGGSAVLHACFSPGRGPLRVLAGFADGTARVWPVDPLPAAKARQPRAELQDWEFAREKRFALPLEYP